MATDDPVRALLDQVGGPALVLHDAACADLAAGLSGDGVSVRPAAARHARARRPWAAVALVVSDELSMRRTVSLLPPPGRSRAVAWWLVDAHAPALVVARPEWPALDAIETSTAPGGGALTVTHWPTPVAVKAVLAQVARDLAAPTGSGGALVATTSVDPLLAPPADPGLVLADDGQAWDADRAVPPDLLLTDKPAETTPVFAVSRRRAVTVLPAELPVGPLDEGLLNPMGFLGEPTRGDVVLEVAEERLRLSGDVVGVPADPGEVTPRLVAALRPHRAVVVPSTQQPGAGLVRAVASLAMAGVPVVSSGTDRDAFGAISRGLGAGTTAALASGVDLADSVSREEYSVRLRRAALLEHSSLAWRTELADRAHVPFRRFPPCTALVLPGHPDHVTATVAELDRQIGVDLEVEVLRAAAHGSPRETLARGAEAARGEVVVVLDPGVRYEPYVVCDLMLARHYSGASVVEMPVGSVATTTGRPAATELLVDALVGGPVAVTRGHLVEVLADHAGHDLGAGLCSDHLAYRTQGLGLTRRAASVDDLG